MAGTAASSLIQVIFENLASTLLNELGLLSNVRQDLETLKSTLLTVQDVLEDAEKRSSKEKSLQNWLIKLKDAAFDADDVLDELQTERLRQKATTGNHKMGMVRTFFSPSNKFAFHVKMAHKIKEIRERLDSIAAERTKFHLVESSNLGRRVVDGQRQTYSFVNEAEIYERDEDKECIVRFLTDMDTERELSILPIVGLGGLGKTTLAQLTYNDERVKDHFELQLWVCISEDFDVGKITKAILECITWNECDLSEAAVEPMQHRLRKKLSEGRFMLVLDDVWNENEEKWEGLKHLLEGGMQGSKVIVTTRSERVASIMGTVASHHPRCLSEECCWNLFKRRAFGRGRGEETPRLVTIGKEIVKKCGGLPLAAKALGSMMGFKRGEGEWLAIRDSDIWKLPEDEIGIIAALRLSYDHLPSHLKRCFAYCSLFPKNYEIDKEKLIQLWIAEGFVLPSNESIHAEDIGNEYFNNLLWRSFFQDVRKDDYVNKVTCKMHDLMHDLAQYVAGYECSTIEIGKERSIPYGCRYLSYICDTKSFRNFKALNKENKLRSFLLLLQEPYTFVDIKCSVKEVPQNMLSSLSLLRVLDLSRSSITELPSTIGSLKHLRLLDLSRTEVKTIPNSIIKLQNLQRLNLEYCRHLRELPGGMRNMINLMHLNIYECLLLTSMPPHMGHLSNLLTLSKFIVGNELGRTIIELKHLNLLKGHLRIDNVENVRNPLEAEQALLKAKTDLRSLSFWWKMGAEVQGEIMDEDVLTCLEPHPNLEQLVMVGYRGTMLPKWMNAAESLAMFEYLVSITLNRLKRCEFLPPLGLLPSLKFLHIYEMDAIRDIGSEFYGHTGTFPSLQELTFWDMPNLDKWSTEVTVTGRELFPCLHYMNIKGCPFLTPQPCLPPSIMEMNVSHSNIGLLLASPHRGLRPSSLKKLDINKCKASSSSSFKWEGLQYFPSLEDLTIQWCEDLTCLSEYISLTQQHQHQFPSLRSMAILHNPNMKSLGDWVYTALEHLEIYGCDKLADLPEWLGGLTSLQSLAIHSCPNLTALPTALQHMTALHSLSIRRCPHLERRCNTDTGEDWHKIAHIPHIDILN